MYGNISRRVSGYPAPAALAIYSCIPRFGQNVVAMLIRLLALFMLIGRQTIDPIQDALIKLPGKHQQRSFRQAEGGGRDRIWQDWQECSSPITKTEAAPSTKR